MIEGEGESEAQSEQVHIQGGEQDVQDEEDEQAA